MPYLLHDNAVSFPPSRTGSTCYLLLPHLPPESPSTPLSQPLDHLALLLFLLEAGIFNAVSPTIAHSRAVIPKLMGHNPPARKALSLSFKVREGEGSNTSFYLTEHEDNLTVLFHSRWGPLNKQCWMPWCWTEWIL